MEKENIWELCPCSEGLINRSKFSSEEILSGAKNEYCSVCGNLLWIPLNKEEAISFVVVSPKLLILKNINCAPKKFWDDFERALEKVL